MAAGMGLNIVGTVMRAAANDVQFGLGLYGAWGGYLQSKMASKMQELSADQLRRRADRSLADADALVATAGKVQRAGEDEAVSRLLRLGQTVGRIYAGAAGGNIEVSSRTVRDAESSARLMAYRDVDAINRSAADRANAYVAQAGAARLQRVDDLTQARLMDIEAAYSRKAAKGVMRSQMVSAVGQWIAGHGSNLQGFMGGIG